MMSDDKLDPIHQRLDAISLLDGENDNWLHKWYRADVRFLLDHIAQQAAEIERLRDALNEIARVCDTEIVTPEQIADMAERYLETDRE